MTANAPPSEKKRRGPGRPFKKGETGNPHGKPTGARSKVLLALDAVGEARTAEIIQVTAERAVQGDMAAAQIILSRTWTPRRGRPTPFSLPTIHTIADTVAALGAVLAAAAAGDLTIDDAKGMASVLSDLRQSMVDQDLRRIAALEAAKEGA